MTYTPKAHYTDEELDSAAIRDLQVDAEQSEEQAVNGPFFPDRDSTAESLLAYAAKCRAKIELYRNGGAHKAIVSGQ